MRARAGHSLKSFAATFRATRHGVADREGCATLDLLASKSRSLLSLLLFALHRSLREPNLGYDRRRRDEKFSAFERHQAVSTGFSTRMFRFWNIGRFEPCLLHRSDAV